MTLSSTQILNARKQLGKNTEESAIDWFITQKKTHLVARNYRYRGGEIDLIFEEQNPKTSEWILVFVEVKCRSRTPYIDKIENLKWHQIQKIKRTAEHFLIFYRGKATEIRFDFLYYGNNQWSYYPNIVC
jgi:putative endonuclease